MKNRILAGVVVAGLIGTSLGCSQTTSTPSAVAALEPPTHLVDTSPFQSSVGYDYDPFASLTEAATAVPFAVHGRVAGWSEGQSLVRPFGVEHFAIMHVNVEPLAQGNTDSATIGVSIPRGVEQTDDDGEPVKVDPAISSIHSVKEFVDAAPPGTRVIVLGTPLSLTGQAGSSAENDIEDNEMNSVGSGEVIIDPHPQGLIFETIDGTFTSALTPNEDVAQWANDPGAKRPDPDGLTTVGTPGSYQTLVDELEALASK